MVRSGGLLMHSVDAAAGARGVTVKGRALWKYERCTTLGACECTRVRPADTMLVGADRRPGTGWRVGALGGQLHLASDPLESRLAVVLHVHFLNQTDRRKHIRNVVEAANFRLEKGLHCGLVVDEPLGCILQGDHWDLERGQM